jgi:hypothetical protein
VSCLSYCSFIYDGLICYFSGGGNVINENLDQFGPALRWMSYEAIGNGLKMTRFDSEWPKKLKSNESLLGFWKALEYCPFNRLSYTDHESTTQRYVSLAIVLIVLFTNSISLGHIGANLVGCSLVSGFTSLYFS